MSIGYHNVTVYDWNCYFGGGYAWHRDEAGNVSVWTMNRIAEEDEEDSYANEYAHEFRTYMRPAHDAGDGRWVDVHTLFTSPDWIVHRFPIMYGVSDEGNLLCMSFEPMQRRMHKSVSSANFRTVSPLLGSAFSAPRTSADSAARAVCRVLEYGHSTPFPTPEGQAPPRDSRHDIHGMLTGNGTKCVVPQTWLAFVIDDEDSEVCHVLRNRDLVGTMSYDKEGKLVLSTSYANAIEDNNTRELALKGLQSTLAPIVGDVIIQEESK